MAGEDRHGATGGDQSCDTDAEYYYEFRQRHHCGRCSPHCAVYRRWGKRGCQIHGKPDFRLCHGICGGLCYALFSGDTGDCELAGSRRRNCVLCKSLPACSHLGYAILIYGQHFFRSTSGTGRYGTPYVSESGWHHAESVPGSVFHDHSESGDCRSGTGNIVGKSDSGHSGFWTSVQTGK